MIQFRPKVDLFDSSHDLRPFTVLGLYKDCWFMAPFPSLFQAILLLCECIECLISFITMPEFEARERLFTAVVVLLEDLMSSRCSAIRNRHYDPRMHYYKFDMVHDKGEPAAAGIPIFMPLTERFTVRGIE